VDRDNACPFLLRVFVKKNQPFRHVFCNLLLTSTREEEFAVRGKEPAGEHNLHTW
jgi:hypothetical protein